MHSLAIGKNEKPSCWFNNVDRQEHILLYFHAGRHKDWIPDERPPTSIFVGAGMIEEMQEER
jgi:hypothetical protein